MGVRYFLHSEKTGNEIEDVALYVETGSAGSAKEYDGVEPVKLAMEQLQEMEKRNLGDFNFSPQS